MRDPTIVVREEIRADIGAIRSVNIEAFGQQTEANIVDLLRINCPGLLSLVALHGEDIVGHILFSPVMIENVSMTLEGMGLAPLAIMPAWQRLGIGALLVRKGIDILRGRSCPFTIVLGHPDYYLRFGFEKASMHGIRSSWEGVPDEAFMILILDKTSIKGVSGIARYRSEFDEAI